MSYYKVYPDTAIHYMVCSTCSSETFAWLAYVFSCAVCGGNEYQDPEYVHTEAASSYQEADIQKQLHKNHCDEIRRPFANLEEKHVQLGSDTMTTRGRKRKRSLSDDGRHERQSNSFALTGD
jgi:hypothetical protein